jgi:acyl-CoA synthetase
MQDLERARSFYEGGHWRGDTFYTLLRGWAEKTPNKMALRDTNTRLSYRSLLEWVDALAESLNEAGLREGDRVSIWLPSRAESAIILLACSRMGYVCNVSLHRDHTCEEAIDLMRQIGTVAFFGQPGYGADADRLEIFSTVTERLNLKKAYRVPPLTPKPGEDDPDIRFSELRRNGISKLPWRTTPDRPMYLAFTSGSTGKPKGVLHSDNTMLSNARAFDRDWHFDENSVLYALGAMSHNIGNVALANIMVCGGELVTHSPHDAKRTLDRLIEIGATSVAGVPTQAIDILTEARNRDLKSLGQVTSFQVGGATVPPALVQGLMELGVTPKNGFGMTENCSFNYSRPTDPPDIIMNTCGRPAEGMEMKVWNQENPDEEVAVGELGELGCRGCSLMLGYFNDQVSTEKSFNRHGWFMTGDLGRIDAQGNVTIAGRKKDLIIRGGHNIHPAKIEDCAMRHSAVIKAAAFPVADERMGEKVCLAVILRHKGAVRPLELLDHLDRVGLSKYDMPEYYIEMEAFPLTASGKVLKRGLTDLVASGALKPEPVRFVRPIPSKLQSG